MCVAEQSAPESVHTQSLVSRHVSRRVSRPWLLMIMLLPLRCSCVVGAALAAKHISTARVALWVNFSRLSSGRIGTKLIYSLHSNLWF